MSDERDYIIWFDARGGADAALMGGKNAALAELARSLRTKFGAPLLKAADANA